LGSEARVHFRLQANDGFRPIAVISLMRQFLLMRRSLRILALTLGSVVYWVATLGIIGLAGYVLRGDCWTERTRAGFDQCMGYGRAVSVAALLFAALLYGIVIWRAGRRR
jgi:hypothetical protein